MHAKPLAAAVLAACLAAGLPARADDADEAARNAAQASYQAAKIQAKGRFGMAVAECRKLDEAFDIKGCLREARRQRDQAIGAAAVAYQQALARTAGRTRTSQGG